MTLHRFLMLCSMLAGASGLLWACLLSGHGLIVWVFMVFGVYSLANGVANWEDK